MTKMLNEITFKNLVKQKQFLLLKIIFLRDTIA